MFFHASDRIMAKYYYCISTPPMKNGTPTTLADCDFVDLIVEQGKEEERL